LALVLEDDPIPVAVVERGVPLMPGSLSPIGVLIQLETTCCEACHIGGRILLLKSGFGESLEVVALDIRVP